MQKPLLQIPDQPAADLPKKTCRPQPLAPLPLQDKILKLVRQASNLKLLKKGINQVIKALNKQRVQLVFLAADCDPLELVMGLPPICQERNIPVCFVTNQASLGRACDIKRSVIAAAILQSENSNITSQVALMRDQVEQLMY